MAPPKLEKRFTMRIYLSKDNTHDLGAMRNGPHRYIAAITRGSIKGEGFEAALLPGGADWVSLDPSTGVSHVDVRTQARTASGHFISVRYTGVMKNDEATVKVLSWAEDARTTEFGEHQWFTGPKFETSDPSLKWIEDAFWVAQGRCVVDGGGNGIEYEIYQVVN
ncbi:hypothetical protein MBLNU13_g03711t1 [Cladosporium sp. NU13]